MTSAKGKDMTSAKRLEYFMVGRIGAAHGLGGEVRVQPLTSDPARFQVLKDCMLVSPDEKKRQNVVVENVRQGPNLLLVKLQGIDDRTSAELLRSSYLAVSRTQAVPLHDNEWFVADLIGCDVRDARYGYLGQLTDVLQPTSQDVYVVHLDNSPDLLIPALKSILLRVDVDLKQIDVRLPEGLYEIYREEKA